MLKDNNYEVFGIGEKKLYINEDYKFGTDALLLARFAAPGKKDVVCDLCTGCGIIPFYWRACHERLPKKIYALDISEEAIGMFRKSVEESGFEDIIFPVCEDLKNITAIKGGEISLVTVNPPYFKKGSGGERLSTAQAIARHETLCDIRDVARAAAYLLKYGGYLKLCHIPERLADVIAAMRENGIEPKKLVWVVSDGKNNSESVNRPWLFLLSGKKGGKPGLIVEVVKNKLTPIG